MPVDKSIIQSESNIKYENVIEDHAMKISDHSWDQYFMTMSYLVSMKSKDPSTRVGAVIVGPDKEIRATGYNGLPRGVEDRVTRYDNRSYKYLAANHAEENAILHCARIGIAIKGCSIYVPWLPCSYCAKSIIQVGIIEVIYHSQFPGNTLENQHNWEEMIQISLEMMKEAKINIRAYNGNVLQISALYREKQFIL